MRMVRISKIQLFPLTPPLSFLVLLSYSGIRPQEGYDQIPAHPSQLITYHTILHSTLHTLCHLNNTKNEKFFIYSIHYFLPCVSPSTVCQSTNSNPVPSLKAQCVLCELRCGSIEHEWLKLHYCSSGSQITGSMSPDRLNIRQLHPTIVGPQFGTCFVPTSWRLEFWSGNYIFWKLCASFK